VSYQKQRIEARKWIAMKLKPKKYGDKLALGNDAENPLELGNTMFGELLKNVELKLQVNNES
jgi:hypothetical protein